MIQDFYDPTPGGLIGNEDCGQMSAWYLFSAMGFYPVCPGDPVFSIGRPLFNDIRVSGRGGENFIIKMKNESPENPYVQRVFLNGKPLRSHFIQYNEIIAGGKLVFNMGPEKTVFWKDQ